MRARGCPCRPSIPVVFVSVLLALLLSIALPLWRLPYEASVESTGALSAAFSQQLIRTTAGLLVHRMTPTQVTISTIAANLRWRPELDSAYAPYSDAFLEEMSRTVLYPAVLTVPLLFAATIMRQGFENGTLRLEQGVSLVGLTNTIVARQLMTADSATAYYYRPNATGVPLTQLRHEFPASVRDERCRQVGPPVTDEALLQRLCQTPTWDDYTYFTPYNTPLLNCALQLPTRDGHGVYVIVVSVLTQSLHRVLAGEVTGQQRMFLTLRRPDGRLVATSHGKFWSHSDAPDAFINLQGVAGVAWYTPEQATDPVIRAAAEALRQRLGTWVVDHVNEQLELDPPGVPCARWLALSTTVEGTTLQLWLLDDWNHVFGGLDTALRRTVIVFAVLLTVAAVGGTFIAFLVTWPLKRFSRLMDLAGADLEQVQQDLQRRDSALYEVHRLQGSFRTMLVSVAAFAKYVPLGVVRGILAAGRAPELSVFPMEVAVMFLDIQRFTTLSSRMLPHEVARLLAVVLGLLSGCITRSGGVIDKYIGDAVMALWGAPLPCPASTPPGLLACRAVAAMCYVIDTTVKDELEEAQLPAVNVRVGVHQGEALVGNVGSPDRYNYTAIGDVVNSAARLEALNKQLGTRCVVSRQVAEAAAPEFRFRDLGGVLLLGRVAPLGVAEFAGALALTPAPTPTGRSPCASFASAPELLSATSLARLTSQRSALLATRERDEAVAAQWAAAMQHYQQRRFAQAAPLFEDLSPALPAAAYFLARSAELRARPEQWRGYETQYAK